MAKYLWIFLFAFTFQVFSDRKGEDCTISVEGDGICRLFEGCPSLYDLFKNSTLSEAEKQSVRQLITRRGCGISKEHKRLVCCSRWEGNSPVDQVLTSTTTSKGIINDEQKSCTTPNGDPGKCTSFSRCPALSVTERSTEAERQFVRDSICSKTGLKFSVCCPSRPLTTTTTVAPEPENKPCVDALNHSGTCILLEDCPHLYKLLIIQITKQNTLFLRKSLCGAGLENFKYFCCSPQTSVPTRETTTVKQILETSTLKPNPPSPPWLASLAAKTSAGCDKIKDRIILGTEAKIDEYAWTVLLEYTKTINGIKNGTSFGCGGSLINRRYVLTAAHCVWKLESGTKLTHVRIGEFNTETEIDCSVDDNSFCAPRYLSVAVTEVITHSRYRGTHSYHHDIAVLRLANDVTFSRFVAHICLPLNPNLWNADNFERQEFEVTGWGRTENLTRSSVKRRADIPYVPRKNCVRLFRSSGINVIDSQICAGGGVTDTCSGDSGGPLMFYSEEFSTYYLVGIVSIGDRNCGTVGRPGIYTKVSDYLEWIDSKID